MGIKSEINITPLVDIVLVLLIIFMVLTPLMHQGYDVSAAKIGPSNKASTYTLIEQTEAKDVLLNHNTVPVAELKDRLQALLPANDSSVVYSGADHLDYHVVAQTLDVIRDSGADRISISTQRED